MVIDADGDGCGWTRMLMLVIITLSEKKNLLDEWGQRVGGGSGH